MNKSDLSRDISAQRIFEEFPDAVEISALSGDGMEQLAKKINEAFLDGDLDLSRDAIVVNERQYAALTQAAELIREAHTALSLCVPVDAVCSDIERAMAALARVDGREVGEDIVGAIFSKFCVGK